MLSRFAVSPIAESGRDGTHSVRMFNTVPLYILLLHTISPSVSSYSRCGRTVQSASRMLNSIWRTVKLKVRIVSPWASLRKRFLREITRSMKIHTPDHQEESRSSTCYINQRMNTSLIQRREQMADNVPDQRFYGRVGGCNLVRRFGLGATLSKIRGVLESEHWVSGGVLAIL